MITTGAWKLWDVAEILRSNYNRVCSRRASLSVRFTDKNGDHAEAGKIWENQVFTKKMSNHRPKCTQIDEGTCQGVIWACQNFFPFTILAVGVTFLNMILHLLQNSPKLRFQISFGAISYFSAPVFHTFLSHHCCSAQHCQSMCGGQWCKKTWFWPKLGQYCCIFYHYS